MARSLIFALGTVVFGFLAEAQAECPPEGLSPYTFYYRVMGTSDGSGYSWCITTDTYTLCDSNVVVPAGASAHDVAVAIAASIASKCPNVTAGTFNDEFHFDVPYSWGHLELWPTLCLVPAGEAASCCIEFGGQVCHLDVDIENYNYSCKCGDADHSFLWTISDAVYLIGYIFGGGPAPERTCEGDADGNKIVTISDAVYMINFIFSGGPAPAGC